VIRGLLLGLALSVATGSPAFAQEQLHFVVQSEVMPGCLAHPSPKDLEFPKDATESAGGVVRVRLTFADASPVPRTEIYTNTAGDAFASRVERYVERYRFGCPVAPDSNLVLLQEFQFVANPGRRILLSPVRKKWASSDCTWTLPPPPPYPSSKLRKVPDFGRVLVQVVFAAPGEAPKTRVLYDAKSVDLARTAEEHAAGVRLACSADAYPVVGVVPYFFRIDGTEVPKLDSSIALVDFLGIVEGVQGSRVYFDFRTMGCPFEFAIYPLQPDNPNVTFWRPGPVDDRREFRAWLETAKMGIPRHLLDKLHGDALKVRVPCVVLNLL